MYNLILVFSLFLSLFPTSRNKTVIFFILWIPSALRYGIGADYFSYAHMFYSMSDEIIFYEPAYFLINKLISILHLDFQYVIAISSLIFLYVGMKSIPTYYFYLSLFVFIITCYFPSYNIIRQMISVVFSATAVAQLLKDNKKGYIIYILAGSLFHISILVLLPFYFLRKMKISPYLNLTLILIFSVIILYTSFLHHILNNSFLGLTKYAPYLTNGDHYRTPPHRNLIMVVYFLIPALMILNAKKITKINPNNCLLITLNLFLIIVSIAATKIYILNRVSTIFLFLPYISVSVLMMSIKTKIIKQVTIITIIFSFIFLYQHIISTNKFGINPYISIFDKHHNLNSMLM